MARQDRYLEPFGNAINPLTGMPIFGDPVTAAVVGVGGSLVSGAMGADASSSAADTQAASSDKATAQQQQMFDTINGQQGPYRDAGYTGLSALAYSMGLGSPNGYHNAQTFDAAGYLAKNPDVAANPYWSKNAYSHYQQHGQAESRQFFGNDKMTTPGVPGVGYGGLTHQFNANDLGTNLSPNYNFMLSQGLGALQNSAAAQGNLVGGNALKGINDYAQNYASNGYQQAYNNYNTNQSNIFDRLSHIAGMGQNANNTSATAGASISPGIASSIQNAGQANASGIVGANNNLTGGLSNAQSWYQYGKNPISGMSPMQEGVKSNIPGYGEVSTF